MTNNTSQSNDLTCRTGTARAGIIIINDQQQILLIKRVKTTKDVSVFYCVPGGHVEPGETPAQTALRELEEETGITNIVLRDAPIFELTNQGRQETYFVAQSWSGNPALGGEEAERNSPENSYKLEWINWQDIYTINLYPSALLEQLLTRGLLQ